MLVTLDDPKGPELTQTGLSLNPPNLIFPST